MRYKIQKHGNRITASSEGIAIFYKGKQAKDVGTIELEEDRLDKVEISVTGKKISINNKVL